MGECGVARFIWVGMCPLDFQCPFSLRPGVEKVQPHAQQDQNKGPHPESLLHIRTQAFNPMLPAVGSGGGDTHVVMRSRARQYLNAFPLLLPFPLLITS